MDTFKNLKTLTETPGPSGNEQAVAAVVKTMWQPYASHFVQDHVGNLMAIKEGNSDAPRRSILLAAHMDEIALMVHEIVSHNGNGFLRVTNVGGVDIRHLYGQLVLVHGRKNLRGVIGSLPGSMLPQEKRNKPFGYEELVVDVGLSHSEVEAQISVGDFVSFHQPLRKLENGRITGKALDNRASIAAVTHCLEYLSQRKHTWDVIAVATVQEETRLLGAFTSTHSQEPDAAIAIDVTFGKGPGANDSGTFELGSGPSLDLGPNVHSGMYKALKKTADSLEMSITTGTHSRASGTDAFGVQIARSGIPTGLISIPLRYMHTMVESISLKDVERSGRLMGEFIAQLDDKFLDKLAAGMMEEDSKQ
ncbi:MAG: M42 family metallopeptidase [Chloroflexi bacterium]|nr:M42 family metallopeptidase [Chloroflexota bacterium]